MKPNHQTTRPSPSDFGKYEDQYLKEMEKLESCGEVKLRTRRSWGFGNLVLNFPQN